MNTEDPKSIDEAQIRALIDERLKAVCAKDLNGAIAQVAPNLLSFDVVNPLQSVGSEAAKRRAEAWFASFQGAIGQEALDLSITAGEDVAFSHCLNRVTGMKSDGQKIDMYWRATVCYRKMDGQWIVTHEHNSVPFDPESGRASLDLKP